MAIRLMAEQQRDFPRGDSIRFMALWNFASTTWLTAKYEFFDAISPHSRHSRRQFRGPRKIWIPIKRPSGLEIQTNIAIVSSFMMGGGSGCVLSSASHLVPAFLAVPLGSLSEWMYRICRTDCIGVGTVSRMLSGRLRTRTGQMANLIHSTAQIVIYGYRRRFVEPMGTSIRQ